MSVIPSESYSSPNLEGDGESKPSPEAETSREHAEQPESIVEAPPEVIREETHDSISDEAENATTIAAGFVKAVDPVPISPKPLQPIAPMIPVVPDQLTGFGQPAFGHREPEPEQIEVAGDNVAEPETLGWEEEPRSAHRRRRSKLIRFVIFEALAIGAVLLFAKLEVNERFSGNSFTYLYGTAMLISALAAAVIPVIFYALPPTLPPGRQ